MNDPTYDKTVIADNDEWTLAFILSEILNDNAPIGWSHYIIVAKILLKTYKMEML